MINCVILQSVIHYKDITKDINKKTIALELIYLVGINSLIFFSFLYSSCFLFLCAYYCYYINMIDCIIFILYNVLLSTL